MLIGIIITFWQPCLATMDLNAFKPSVVVDHKKAKKKSYKICYDLLELAWFKEPSPNNLFFNPAQRDSDTFGLWEKSVKRPTMDRHFCPSASTSEDHKESFLTYPPSICADPKMKDLLKSKPLVGFLGGRKLLDFPDPLFEKNHTPFKEIPLFAITQHQANLSLCNTASMSQLCNRMQDYMSWILENWDNYLDLSAFPGSSSPDNRFVGEPATHSVPIKQQILSDMIGDSNWLFDCFPHIRYGLKLVSNGLHSSMEYNTAMMIASSHLGRQLVLSHCGEKRQAN